MYTRLDTLAGALARLLALAGGMVLIALVIMTCVSITGRTLIPLGLSPVKGDFEWIEMGVAFAVFAFLPWCQYARGHARVDLFAGNFSRGMNRFLDLVSDLFMLIAATIIAWRLWLGMLEKQQFGETTFILQYPIWYAYAAAMLGAATFAAVSAFCVLRSGRAPVPVAVGPYRRTGDGTMHHMEDEIRGLGRVVSPHSTGRGVCLREHRADAGGVRGASGGDHGQEPRGQ